MLNCFRYSQIYILKQMSQKNQTRKIILKHIKSSRIIFCVKMTGHSQWFFYYIKSLCVKMTRYSQRLFNYIKSLCGKMIQYSQMVYTPKALLSKNRFYFFFFKSSHMQKFHHFLGCHVISTNFSFKSSLSTLGFSNLICQTKSLIWIIVSGSYSI